MADIGELVIKPEEAMAKAGYNYRQIISHYYPNTYIEKVSY